MSHSGRWKAKIAEPIIDAVRRQCPQCGKLRFGPCLTCGIPEREMLIQKGA